MSKETRSPVRWVALGALAVAVAAAVLMTRAPPAPVVTDAGLDAAIATRASVALFDDGAPMAGRIVVFQAADGHVLATTRSGADGKATGPMPSHGMITVAYGSSLQRLVTVTGVEPGDEVLVGEDENDEASAGDTSAIAKVALPGAYPTAARYGVELGVGENSVLDAGAPLRLPVMRRYLDHERRFQVLGLAYDADGGTLAYAHGETTAAEAGDTEVKLQAWKTDWRSQRVRILHPLGFGNVKVDFAVHVGEARFDHRESAPLHHPDTNLSLDVPRPLGANATYRIEAQGEGNARDRLILVRRDEKMPELVLLDLAEGPRVSMATTVEGTEPGRPVLKWKRDGDASSADALVLQLAWPETKEHVWTVLAPPTVESFAFPALPDELAGWRPGAGPKRPAVALVEVSELAGYADVKKKWIQMLGELPEENGSLRMSLTGDIDF